MSLYTPIRLQEKKSNYSGLSTKFNLNVSLYKLLVWNYNESKWIPERLTDKKFIPMEIKLEVLGVSDDSE